MGGICDKCVKTSYNTTETEVKYDNSQQQNKKEDDKIVTQDIFDSISFCKKEKRQPITDFNTDQNSRLLVFKLDSFFDEEKTSKQGTAFALFHSKEVYKNNNGKYDLFYCVTAASCVSQFKYNKNGKQQIIPDRVHLSYQLTNKNKKEIYSVSDVIIHSQYNGYSDEYNIALLCLIEEDANNWLDKHQSELYYDEPVFVYDDQQFFPNERWIYKIIHTIKNSEDVEEFEEVKFSVGGFPSQYNDLYKYNTQNAYYFQMQDQMTKIKKDDKKEQDGNKDKEEKESNTIYYKDLQLSEGQEGGPILLLKNDGECVHLYLIGVHAGRDRQYGWGIKFSQEIMSWMKNYVVNQRGKFLRISKVLAKPSKDQKGQKYQSQKTLLRSKKIMFGTRKHKY